MNEGLGVCIAARTAQTVLSLFSLLSFARDVVDVIAAGSNLIPFEMLSKDGSLL